MRHAIYSALRKFKRSNMLGLRNLVNLAYYDPKTVVLHYDRFDYVVVDGCKFYASDQIDSLQRVEGNPWFEGVRPTDTVVDIGANIGAITIPLAKVAQYVVAVEPLFFDELVANRNLNELKNVFVLKAGLGNHAKSAHIGFSSKEGDVPLMSFLEIKKTAGGRIDFLKVDCEGYEWDLEPEWVKGIRELRFEFHIRRHEGKRDWKRLDEWKYWLEQNGYKYVLDWGESPSICVPFEACAVMRASVNERNA